MKRGEAGKLLDHGAYLTMSERMIFLLLLERADNGDCSIPDRMAPRLETLARRSGSSRRTVRRALSHLDEHGWVDYEPARGRGHRGSFQVAPRRPDPDCACQKGGHQRPPFGEKGGHQGLKKGDTEGGHVAGQKRYTAQGQEGEEAPGESSEQTATLATSQSETEICDRVRPDRMASSEQHSTLLNGSAGDNLDRRRRILLEQGEDQ